jgi:hypothetical protein
MRAALGERPREIERLKCDVEKKSRIIAGVVKETSR